MMFVIKNLQYITDIQLIGFIFRLFSSEILEDRQSNVQKKSNSLKIGAQ